MHTVLDIVVAGCFAYFLCVFIAFAFMFVGSALQHRRILNDALTHDDSALALSRFTIPVSVIAPAFNEDATIEACVRSLLALDYPEFEVIVVNDGSHDATLDVLIRAFDLEPHVVFYRRPFETRLVRGVYR